MKRYPTEPEESAFANDMQSGLTKREYYAGLAMQGYSAYVHSGHQDPHGVAKYSVELADALIEALNKQENGK